MNITDFFGVAGVALVMIAYLPQVVHLIREHCSAGISIKAYVLWLIAAGFLWLHAMMIFDVTFIVLQTINVLTNAVILLYAQRYKSQVCRSHQLLKT